jgi:hypothetical protein
MNPNIIEYLRELTPDGHGGLALTSVERKPDGSPRFTRLPVVSSEEFEKQQREPIRVWESVNFGGFFAFRGMFVSVREVDMLLPEQYDELVLHIKHKVLRHEKGLSRIRREVEAFENLHRLPSARRERIPEAVRMFVWQRDQGKCVKCGSQVNLEFDHIIPVADGGADTERNIQLLCERCNREKGRSVG